MFDVVVEASELPDVSAVTAVGSGGRVVDDVLGSVMGVTARSSKK